jgi:hypothetical protein
LETVKTKPATFKQPLIIALMVLVACFALFYLDKDTHSISDLFKPGNLVALIIYFTPTFIISIFLFNLFLKKTTGSKSMWLSLLTGIPLSFFLVICFMLSQKP